MNKLRIPDGKVFTGEGFARQTLYVLDARFVREEEYARTPGRETLAETGDSYVIPGLTDLHFHGCVGSDCCDGTEEAFHAMACYEARNGVTGITPATMTMPEPVLMKVAEAAASYSAKDGAALLGLYMEGPFISQKKKGAQNAAYIRRPDAKLFHRLQDAAGGMFRTVAVAPETEGAIDMIRALSDEVRLSVAHTEADYETCREAFAAGASQVTHLYNAMPPFSHRAPGPVGAAADDPDCRVELICDGVHVHPSCVRATFRLFGDERVILISDTMRAAGMPDGSYDLGGQEVTVRGNRATLSDGTIAGSVTNLMQCMQTAVRDMGIPLASAVRAAAVNPAKALGVYDEYGSLTPGKYANFVILDENLRVQEVYLKGRKL